MATLFRFAVVIGVPLSVGILIHGWARRNIRDAYPSQAWKPYTFLLSLAGGFIVAFPSLGFLLLTPPGRGVSAYLKVSLVEELGKAVLPALWVKAKGMVSIQRIMLLFVGSALGFSLFENLLFLAKDPEVSYLRSFTSVPLHALCSAFFGYAYGYSRYHYKRRTIPGAVAATLLHGLYNAGWEFSPWLSLGILILGFPAVALLWHKARLSID